MISCQQPLGLSRAPNKFGARQQARGSTLQGG